MAVSVVGGGVTASDELADHCHLEGEIALAGAGIAGTFEPRHDDPVTELTRGSDDHDAACIVVGSHGHRPRAQLLLGSTTDHAVHQGDRPVLVVPPTPR